jgi:hypothetical protein
LISDFLEYIRANDMILGGRHLPLVQEAGFVQLKPGFKDIWQLGFISDTAYPHMLGAAPPLAGIRVFTAEEWAKVSGLPPSPSLPPVASDANLIVEPSKGGAPRKVEDAFIREMVRFAALDGFDTRLQLTKHMKEWCAATSGDAAPSDRSVERWVERWCPYEIPKK